MQLNLLGTFVKKITDYNGNLFHFTEAGVDIHALSDGVKLAYASLANVTSGAVNDNGIYLGTSDSGIYKLTHQDLLVGGDLTSNLIQEFSTAATISIQSNEINALAGRNLELLISSSLGVEYISDSSNSTVLKYSNASGSKKCAIGKYHIAYEANDISYFLAKPSYNWYSGIPVAPNFNSFSSEIKSQPSYPSGSTGRGVSWYENYVAFVSTASPYLHLYSFDGEELYKEATSHNPGRASYSCEFDSEGYLAVGCYGSSTSDALILFKKEGNIFTKVYGINFQTASVNSVRWFGPYLLAGVNATIYFFKRIGDTLQQISSASASGYTINDISWNADGTYFAAVTDGYSSSSSSNQIALFKVELESMTRVWQSGSALANGSYANSVAWNGDYLAVGASKAPWLNLFKREEDSLIKLPNENHTSLPTKTVNSLKWVGDLLLTGPTTGNILMYKKEGDSLVQVLNFGSAGSYAWAIDCKDDYIVTALQSTPYIRFYKMNYLPIDQLGTKSNDLAFGYNENLFIGTDTGIMCLNIVQREYKNIIEEIGSVKNVTSICPTSNTTLTSGLLAYGTADGSNNGQFDILNLNEI